MNVLNYVRMAIEFHCLQQGNCSTRWGGFDGCPVAIATDIKRYCRTEVTVEVRKNMTSLTEFLLYCYC